MAYLLEGMDEQENFQERKNKMKMKLFLIVLITCIAMLACSKTNKPMEDKMVIMQNGLKFIDTTVGTGDEATSGKNVAVHYTGWLEQKGKKGQKFDSSVDRGVTFKFPLGAGRVIKGWDEGVQGMKEGGKRTLIIPSDLGYGSRGAGAVIPPNSTLIFDVELVDVK